MHLLNELLKPYTPLSLRAMEAAKLLRRRETKYLLPAAVLPALLARLAAHYYALEIAGEYTFRYRTEYYDTPRFGFYLDHHNGAAMRIKVRQRWYEHISESFFEIKQKQHDGRIHKIRRPATALSGSLNGKARQLIMHPGLQEAPLEYTLSTAYTRITLCAHNFDERITIDTGIRLTAADGNTRELENLAIVEVKQGHINHGSAAVLWLKKQHVPSISFSKYVTGIALFHPELKHNNFKPQLIKIHLLAHAFS